MIPEIPPTGRYTHRWKAAILECIGKDRLTIPQAIDRYNLTLEEIDCWTQKLAAGGIGALKATLQRHRERPHQYGVYRAGKAT